MQIPWLFPIFIFSLTFNKIPWLFPDFCQVWNFPDFSLTAGHPVNHLCHMGGRYLVTMIPGRMEMYWGSVLMCATYKAMFWGITLWLAMHVGSVALVWDCLGSQVGYQGILDLGRVCEWCVWDQLARELPLWNKRHWKRTRSYSSL